MEEKQKEKQRERQNGDQTPEVLGGPTDRRSLNVMLEQGSLIRWIRPERRSRRPAT